jgi:hypothetical protein
MAVGQALREGQGRDRPVSAEQTARVVRHDPSADAVGRSVLRKSSRSNLRTTSDHQEQHSERASAGTRSLGQSRSPRKPLLRDRQARSCTLHNPWVTRCGPGRVPVPPARPGPAGRRLPFQGRRGALLGHRPEHLDLDGGRVPHRGGGLSQPCTRRRQPVGEGAHVAARPCQNRGCQCQFSADPSVSRASCR